MKRRGATLIHTLVILLSGMIAAGGVAAFASFAYHTVAATESQTRAQFAMEGAIAEAKYDVWAQSLAAGQSRSYTIDGVTVTVSLTDTNAVTASTWLARAEAEVDNRDYTFSRTVGLNKFPSSSGINWIYNPANEHYYAVVRVRGGMTPATAEANARNLRAPNGKPGYLATITSQAEWNWVKQKLLPPLNGATALLGGKQTPLASEPGGGWTWTTGEAWSYTDWRPGQPDNNAAGGEDWLAIHTPVGESRWSDVSSSAAYTIYLVEAGDWVTWITDPRTKRKYTFVPQFGLTWEQARDAAAAIKGPDGEPTYLLSINSSFENQFVTQTLLPAFGSPNGGWFGAYQPPGSAEPASDWRWASGEPWGWTNWGGGEPNNYAPQANGNEEDAGHIYSNGVWNDIWNNPVGLWGAIPGYWVEAGEPLNWQFNSTTQRWYAVVPVLGSLNWTEASTWAQQLVGPNGKPGYLATLTTSQEAGFVSQMMADFPLIAGESILRDWGWSRAGGWIGYRQVSFTQEPAGGWSWVTGEAAGFNLWGGGQPDNNGGNEHNAHLNLFNGQWVWNDIPESSSLNSFIVEAGDNFPRWIQNPANGNWYVYMPSSTGLTWSQAKAQAATMTAPNGQPAYLATITNRDEETFVRTQVVPPTAPLFSPPGWNAVAWLGGRQQPGSWESKMGWEWDNGEGMSSYWGSINMNPSSPAEPNEGSGLTVSGGSSEDYLWLSLFNSGTTSNWMNWYDSAGPFGFVAEAGTPSQMWSLVTGWRCQWDGTANFHPDSARYAFPVSDFQAALGAFEWPVLSSSAISRGLTDFNPSTNEWLLWSAGDRGSNRVVGADWSGPQSLPFDSILEDPNGPVSNGRRLVHAKGTIHLADQNAINTVAISVPGLDNGGWVWINGQYAFTHGQSLTNRSLLKIGENRIDFFTMNWGGPGTMTLNCSVPIRPYARPLAQTHPFQYGLAVSGAITTGSSPVLSVEGNVYAGGAVPSGLGAGSSVRGFWLNRQSGTPGGVVTDYLLNSQAALNFPSFSIGSYAGIAAETLSSGSTLTNPSFASQGAVIYSPGTLNVSGHYTGRGVIVADTVVIAGHLNPTTVESDLVIVANNVTFGGSSSMTHRVGAFVYCSAASVARPTVLTGALAAGTLNLSSGTSSALTIRHEDSLWRQNTLASLLRVPGYWNPSRLTGTYYTYAPPGSASPMQDLKEGEINGGSLRGTVSGRLGAGARPLASPLGRTQYQPALTMNQTAMPGRVLNWWTAGQGITLTQFRVDPVPLSQSFTHQGVWWTGGFDMANQAAIDALTMQIVGSDDFTVVYINGVLALDHGGKHGSGWPGPGLTDKSMVRVGANRIDIFTADLWWGGGISFTSNALFYPTPTATLPAVTADRAYNWSIYVQNSWAVFGNTQIFGDVMAGPLTSTGTGSRFRGLAWTSGSTWPSGIAYDGVRVSQASLLAAPVMPAQSEYANRAAVTLSTSSISGATAPTSSPHLIYRNGDLAVSGQYSGSVVIVATGNVTISSSMGAANAASSLTIISYGQVNFPSGSAITVGADILAGTTNISRPLTLQGSLWTQSISQTASMTISPTGRHFFSPENWTRSFLPGFLP